MKKSHIIELLIFVILLTILAFVGIKVFKNTFDIGKTYHVEFTDIDSIVIGSPVRILGVDIGHVTKIQSSNDNDKIYVDFVVTDEAVGDLPDGTGATIEFFGIAGSRSIELTPPTEKTDEKGLIVSDPIRIGDALSIMAKFLKATMVSVGGLYELTKGKTQQQFTDTTNKFLTTTRNTNQILDTLNVKVEKGGAKLHTSFEGTNKGMTKVYDDISALNINKTFKLSRYSINFVKRSLIVSHRNIDRFNSNSGQYVEKANTLYNHANSFETNLKNVDKLRDAFQSLDETMNTLDNNISRENIDKACSLVEKIKIISDNLK